MTHKVYVPETQRVIETIHAKFIENPAVDQGELHHHQQPSDNTQVNVPVLSPPANIIPQAGDEAAEDISGDNSANHMPVHNDETDHIVANSSDDARSSSGDSNVPHFRSNLHQT